MSDEALKNVVELLKQAIKALVGASEQKEEPNFVPGKLIGIGDQRVFFVESIKDGKVRVSAYSPVGRERYRILSDCENAIDYDEDNNFHEGWVNAVNDGDTEDGYREWAESEFNDKQGDADPACDIWFYGQELNGFGSIALGQDEELREAVNEDMEEFWSEDKIGSWEDADSSELPEHWDKIYSQEIVDWLERQRKEEN